VKAKWPGSVHDSRIFRDSHLYTLFERGKENYTYQAHCIIYTFADPKRTAISIIQVMVIGSSLETGVL